MAENSLSRNILIGFGDCQEIIKNFDSIKMMFSKGLAELHAIKEVALDTKSTQWNDAFSSSREAIQRSLDRAGMEVISMINKEMQKIQTMIEVKDEYYKVSQIPKGPFELVFYRDLLSRLQKIFKNIIDTPALNATGQAAESKELFEELNMKIKSLINIKTNEVIKEGCELNIDKLNNPVITFNSESSTFYPNLDQKILKYLNEMTYFEKMQIKPLSKENDLKLKDIKISYEFILKVCSKINRLMRNIENYEQEILNEKITQLYKSVSLGLKKICWTDSKVIQNYSAEVDRNFNIVSNKLLSIRKSFNECNDLVEKLSEDLSFNIFTANSYLIEDLLEKMNLFSTTASHQINRKIEKIFSILMNLKLEEFNLEMSEKVENTWKKYIENIDFKIENILAKFYSNALEEFDKTFEEGSEEPLFILDIKICIDNNSIDFDPDLEELIEKFSAFRYNFLNMLLNLETISSRFDKNDQNTYINLKNIIKFDKIEEKINSKLKFIYSKLFPYLEKCKKFEWIINNQAEVFEKFCIYDINNFNSTLEMISNRLKRVSREKNLVKNLFSFPNNSAVNILTTETMNIIIESFTELFDKIKKSFFNIVENSIKYQNDFHNEIKYKLERQIDSFEEFEDFKQNLVSGKKKILTVENSASVLIDWICSNKLNLLELKDYFEESEMNILNIIKNSNKFIKDCEIKNGKLSVIVFA
ncbi:MAG: hypothetical protein MHPSP_000039 [Paramarteilia canceri]